MFCQYLAPDGPLHPQREARQAIAKTFLIYSLQEILFTFIQKNMEFKQLISDFSTRHGVEHLAPEDNTVAFNVDGIPVLIAADEDEVAMISEIGEPPVEGRADFADLLLATNFNEKGAVFGKSQDSGKYVLIRRLPLVDIDGGAFDAALEELVNQAESWRNLLAAFRPAAEEAASAKIAPPAIGLTGFLRV